MLVNTYSNFNRRLPATDQDITWQTKGRALFLGLLSVVIVSAILTLPVLPIGQVTLEVDEVSPRDIRAPLKKTYVSQVLTEQERARAEAAVKDVYDPPDPQVARRQIVKARQICDYIDSIRNDSYATLERKGQWIAAIPDLSLSPEIIDAILVLRAEEWKNLVEQTIEVLGRAMRRVIQENQLTEAKRSLPTDISLDLSEKQAAIVIALVRNLIRPNSFYNADKTAEAKQQARGGVPQVTQDVEKGEIILRAGDIVTPLHLEVLDALGLRQPKIAWADVIAAILFALVIVFGMALYIIRFQPAFWKDLRSLSRLSALLIFFALIAKVMVEGHTVLPYLFPLATLSMLLSILFDPQLAIMTTILLSATVGFLSDGSLELTAYSLFGGVVASLRLGRVERMNVLFWSGAYVATVNLALVLTFRLPGHNYDTPGLLALIGVSLANGALAASLTMAGLVPLSNIFGVLTSFQLHELARPTHPLLRQLLLKAPGTYHHSILVSNLAEQGADSIGADGLLARVGAYYHDIGKIARPYFFVDNQVEGVNVHDRLDPYTSAQVIVSHVKDGLDLAKKYDLPPRIRDFITEHQGTGLVSYFYQEALKESEPPEAVDEAQFRYPGPRPRSKETAIVMLADSCEAVVRSARPNSPEEIDKLVRKIINDKLSQGELDDSDLTLQDLKNIRAAFVKTLQGVFHPRVKYPEPLKKVATGVKKEARKPTAKQVEQQAPKPAAKQVEQQAPKPAAKKVEREVPTPAAKQVEQEEPKLVVQEVEKNASRSAERVR